MSATTSAAILSLIALLAGIASGLLFVAASGSLDEPLEGYFDSLWEFHPDFSDADKRRWFGQANLSLVLAVAAGTGAAVVLTAAPWYYIFVAAAAATVLPSVVWFAKLYHDVGGHDPKPY